MKTTASLRQMGRVARLLNATIAAAHKSGPALSPAVNDLLRAKLFVAHRIAESVEGD